MKKIIAAIDALHFTEEQLEGFAYIAREANAELTIVFLEDIAGYKLPAVSDYTNVYYQYLQGEVNRARKEREQLGKAKLEELKTMCEARGIRVKLQEAPGYPADEVKDQSRFADMLLINHATSFALLDNSNPPRFIKDLLVHAECPVMVMPEQLTIIREVIFSYNGSFSSMYAIRRFTQLFPSLRDMPVQVVYADEKGTGEMPRLDLLKAYLEPQYDHIAYTVLQGSSPATVFLSLLGHRKDCLVTFGAYGRNPLSRFFHRSDAESILRALNIPLFITHP